MARSVRLLILAWSSATKIARSAADNTARWEVSRVGVLRSAGPACRVNADVPVSTGFAAAANVHTGPGILIMVITVVE